MKAGYVQVYTGNGKGKTTCALGLALRAVGAGMQVYFGQFLKRDDYSEIKALKERFPEVDVAQYGSGEGFVDKKNIKARDIEAARRGYDQAAQALASGRYDLIILDEINVAVHLGLLLAEDVLRLIVQKPPGTELVLTGRNACPEIVEKADLVTEMKEIKHYYQQGVPARVGIEK